MSSLARKCSSHPTPAPVSRYAVSNPLRREWGIRLLTCTLPEPLRLLVGRGLRRQPLFDGTIVPFAVQSLYRSRLSDADLARMSQRGKAAFVLAEVEVAWRIIESPQDSIQRGLRNALLMLQGAELLRLYRALLAQLGEGDALAVFQRALDAIG